MALAAASGVSAGFGLFLASGSGVSMAAGLQRQQAASGMGLVSPVLVVGRKVDRGIPRCGRCGECPGGHECAAAPIPEMRGK